MLCLVLLQSTSNVWHFLEARYIPVTSSASSAIRLMRFARRRFFLTVCSTALLSTFSALPRMSLSSLWFHNHYQKPTLCDGPFSCRRARLFSFRPSLLYLEYHCPHYHFYNHYQKLDLRDGPFPWQWARLRSCRPSLLYLECHYHHYHFTIIIINKIYTTILIHDKECIL